MFFEDYMGDASHSKQAEQKESEQAEQLAQDEESLHTSELGLLDIEPPDADDEETYTVQQVMALLNVGRTTVYNLAKRGLIKTREYLRNERTIQYFTQSSVHAFKENVDSFITVKGVAAEFNFTVPHTFQLLKKHNIPYELNEQNFTRPTSVLSQDSYEKICAVCKELQSKVNHNRLSSFIYKGYGLHQAFQDGEGRIVRLTISQKAQPKKWGFFVNNAFLELETALKQGFTPLYSLKNQKKATKQKSYAVFQCQSYLVDVYEWIDYLYKNVGIRDLSIMPLDNGQIQISLKAGEYLFNEEELNYLSVQWLKERIVEGDVLTNEAQPNVLIIYGSHRSQTYHLKTSTYQLVEDLTVKFDCSQSEVIEMALALLKERVYPN